MSKIKAKSCFFNNIPSKFQSSTEILKFQFRCRLPGPNCWKIEEKDDQFFKDVGHLRVMARDMLWALAELDSVGVIHCDVKPDNIVRLDVTDEDRGAQKFSHDAKYCPEYVFDLDVVVCKAQGRRKIS